MQYYTLNELRKYSYDPSRDVVEKGVYVYIHPSGKEPFLVKQLPEGFFEAIYYSMLSTSVINRDGYSYSAIFSYRVDGKIVKFCDVASRSGTRGEIIYFPEPESMTKLLFSLKKNGSITPIYRPLKSLGHEGIYPLPKTLPRRPLLFSTSRPGFVDLKKKLNLEKKKIEQVGEKYYYIASSSLRDHAFLLGRESLLKKYTASKITNAWLKFYETILFLDSTFAILPFFGCNSLHVAEAPGNFVCALNHYINTKKPVGYRWDWRANTYEDSKGDMGYLSDDLGLIKKYRNKWLLGPSGTGDITLKENILSFGKYHLVTSDVKVVSEKDPNYDEEENMNAAVHLGHILVALESLVIGGTAILKHFTLFESFSHDLITIFASCFEQCFIYKPETSKAGNSEVYLVGLRFQQNPYGNSLYPILEKIRTEQNYSPKKNIFDSIPKYMEQFLYELQNQLAENQTEEISRMVGMAKILESKQMEKRDLYGRKGELYFSPQNLSRPRDTSMAWIEKYRLEKTRVEL